MAGQDGRTSHSSSAIQGNPAFEEFYELAEKYRVKLSTPKKERIQKYISELIRWNRKINLTSSSDIREILIWHFLDSIVPAAHLGGVNSLMDVGAGAGFPGIPIKIARPEIQVVLVESRRKKASFLKQVVSLLGMSGIETLCSRAEDKKLESEYRDRPFDALITRAAIKDKLALDLGRTLLHQDGKILLMKGELSGSERQTLEIECRKYDRSIAMVIPYRLPGITKERNLVLIQ